MTIDEMIAVLQAAKQGKAIQSKNAGDWRDDDIISVVNSSSLQWRVKPEPKVLWVNETSTDLHYAYSSRAAAQGVPTVCVRKAVKYVEVVE